MTTIEGERIERAIVSMQVHAPFEPHRDCRLATDIAALGPSPWALPLKVRTATAQADETRMGFAPTVVELETGEAVALNWRPNFFVRDSCDATRIRLSARPFAWDMPVAPVVEDTVYFVADPPD